MTPTFEQIAAVDDVPLSREDAAALLAAIDDWCARTGTAANVFGQMALDFGGFVGLLRRRGTARARIAFIARAFIVRWPEGVPPGERDAVRTAAFNALFRLRVPDPRRGRVSLDTALDQPPASEPSPRTLTGPRLAELIRALADERGVSLTKMLRPFGITSSSLANFARAKSVMPATITRLRPLLGAALDAFDLPEQPLRSDVVRIGRPQPTIVSRDPCPRCGARGDYSCGHARRVALPTYRPNPAGTLGGVGSGWL